MAGILTALLSGALMSIQGVFNTEVTKQTSTWLAAGWVQISAFAVCLAAWCITGREPIGDLFRVKPWYLLLGGAIGAFITITVIWSMAGLGPAKAAMLIVISHNCHCHAEQLAHGEIRFFHTEKAEQFNQLICGNNTKIKRILQNEF